MCECEKGRGVGCLHRMPTVNPANFPRTGVWIFIKDFGPKTETKKGPDNKDTAESSHVRSRMIDRSPVVAVACCWKRFRVKVGVPGNDVKPI